MPVSADFASIGYPFGIAPLPNAFAALSWLFSAIVLISSIAPSSYFLMKVSPLADETRPRGCQFHAVSRQKLFQAYHFWEFITN